ncbi:uncharacterized protein LOC108222706 [Daucus carota subsp. sativus]|uniref:uncharacterized protein LOC108222706 n=1 Tax=Daucus carota subsp. sativus TaxID=79200 RepID=UPI0007F031A8|nr:PREDICTED: uncharacterized protein LOC108222706 [Daucus carota subsp. sativus]
MVQTRQSSASPSVASGSRSKSKGKMVRAKKAKLAVALKKSKLTFHDDLCAPPRGMKYEIPISKHKGAKISTSNRYEPMTELRTLLSEKQLEEFRKCCFGHFLDIPHFKLQNQLIHNLLLRQLDQSNSQELWIGVGGIKMKFGLKEFATITGLLCAGSSDKMRWFKTENQFVSDYYQGINPICKSSVRNVFISRQWKTDNDAVKMGKLYFLHHFLLTSTTDTQIAKGDFDMLDSDSFDDFPWGKEIFKVTLESLKSSVRTTSKDNYYRLNGFPYAFQVWFYECCPYLNGKYCERIAGHIPRCLNWKNDYLGRFDEFYTTLSLNSTELELKELAATAEEVDKFKLDIIVVPANNVKKVTTVDRCLDNSDNDFVDPLP